jgi:hypothetical protein
MANDSKVGNLLKFTEYDHLQPKQNPTKYTEIGGYSVLEGLSVKKLLKIAAKNSGKSKKELKDLTLRELKKLCKGKEYNKKELKKNVMDYEKDGKWFENGRKDKEKDKEDEKKDESLVLEASAKQKAARAKFMEMINKKKKDKGDGKDKKEDKKEEGETKPKRLYRSSPEKSGEPEGKAWTSESLVLEASAKQKAARAKFMEMINKKKGKKNYKN